MSDTAQNKDGVGAILEELVADLVGERCETTDKEDFPDTNSTNNKPDNHIDKILEPYRSLRCIHCGNKSFEVHFDDATQAIDDFYRNKILEVVNLYGNPRCENMHHSKEDRHTTLEDCPVEKRIDTITAQFNSRGSDAQYN